nr:O-antigen ligase family protein [Polymorphobacter sp.]
MARRIGLAALLLAVFFAPYLAWRPFEIMFTASDALFCIAALFLGLGGAVTTRPLGALTPWWMLAFVIMVAGLFIGSIVNGEPLRWAIAVAQYGFALIVLPFLLIGHGIDKTNMLARTMLAGLVAMETFGIAVYFLSSGSFEDHQKFGQEFISGTRRLGAFMMDANWNGAFIAMLLPFVLYLHAKRQLAGWQALIAGAILVEALVLAASVSALACAVFGVIAMLLVSGRRLNIWPILAGITGIAVYLAAGGSLPQAFNTRIAPAIDTGNIAAAGTFSGRFSLIEEAWHMVGDTMFVGLGVDQYRVVSATGAPVHNMYLLLWTEGGLLALFGWMLLLAVLVAAAALVYKRDRMTAALALSVVTALVVSSTASPHMYARLWMVPVMVAMAFVHEHANRGSRP